MQPGGGLVQQVKSLAGLALAQLARQLDALRLAAGKGYRRLAQMNISQSHIDQRLQLLPDLRNVLQHRQCVGDRRFQQVGNGVAVVLHRQRLLVVAPPAANLAQHIDIWQEIHLDAALALALAGLAAPASYVEGKPPGLYPRSRDSGSMAYRSRICVNTPV